MGRSNKKINKEKINALKKKYDDFLEEDKKRKERNEYILGRLEKMRSCVAVVQSYHKMEESLLDYRHSSVRSNSSQFTFHTSDVKFKKDIVQTKNKCLDNMIMKEISDKYILIPKTNSFHKCVQPEENLVVDNDWKSKYNILEKLKQEEKEEIEDELEITPSKLIDDDFKEGCKSLLKNNDEYSIMENNILHLNNYENQDIESSAELNQKLNTKKDFKSSNENIAVEDGNNESKEVKIERSKEALQPNEHIPNAHDTHEENYIDYPEYNSQQILSPTSKPDIFNENNVTQNNNYEDVQAEHVYSSNMEPVSTKPLEDFDKNVDKTDERKEKDDQTAGNIDYVENINQDTNQPNLEYETQEVPMTSQQNNEQIAEFEAEQNEMFYTDETNTAYVTNEVNVDPSGYPIDNNYSDAAFTYYEGTQEGQTYSQEIDEHKETTDNYDPNYEEQYVNSYGNAEYLNQYENQSFQQDPYSGQQSQNVDFENPQQENVDSGPLYSDNVKVSEQDNSQNIYENTLITGTNENNMENEQIYEQNYQNYHQDETLNNSEYLPSEHETQEAIEQQLDAEDSYIVKQETVVNDSTDENICDAIPEALG